MAYPQNMLTKLFKVLTVLLAFCFCMVVNATAQITSVTTVQNLQFGAFSQGSVGGSLIVSEDGTRSSAGSVVPLNLGQAYFPAIFEIEASQGTIVSILKGPDAILTGSNGGTMRMQLGNTGGSFIITKAPPMKTQVNIGGILTVGDSQQSPAGTYSGTFYVIFNNE